MLKAGIVGGLGPESTVEYYKGINRQFQLATGRQDAFPNFILESVNVYEMLGYCGAGEYEKLTGFLLRAIDNLHAAGADFAALAANTPHIVFDALAARSPIPLLSIVDATCEAVRQAGIKRVALLGTRFTMQGEFYRKPFVESGIAVHVPDIQTAEQLDALIVNELERGIIKDETRAVFTRVIASLVEDGAEGVILGCTELPLLLSEKDVPVPIYDTMAIHIQRIVQEMLR